MSIVHEAVCDGCGKRESATYPFMVARDITLVMWETMEHPEGWFLVAIAGADESGTIKRVQGYCSRRCVALGEDVARPVHHERVAADPVERVRAMAGVITRTTDG
jgi:hypothetical protein